jgi:ABC-type branched-subunit amino acid transport system ATPase component
LIEHDIDRVLELSDRITVLHQGRLIADGKAATVARNPEVIAAYLGKSTITPVVSRLTSRIGPPLLTLQGVCAGYAGSQVLTGIDMTLRKNEVVVLLGRNGVGKTTTLNTVTGLVRAEAGAISFDGADITNLPAHEINRRGLALVPEGRRLFPNLTVAENLRIAQRPGGSSLTDVFAIFPKLLILAGQNAARLSGGERQMVAIARALMAPAKVILMDEPFEGLAPVVVQEVVQAVMLLRERASVMIVEHNADIVLPMADRAYVMVSGRIAFEGPAADLQADEPLQARLLGFVDEAPRSPMTESSRARLAG